MDLRRERYDRVAAARQDEQQLMVDYERTDACRMAFLQECLDDDSAVPCGRCDGCAGPWYPTDVPDTVVGAARERLQKVGTVIDARAQWPSGMDRLGVPVKGRIAADEQLEPGRALARLSDLGWGQRLREVLREDAPPPPSSCGPASRSSPSGAGRSARWPWSRCPRARTRSSSGRSRPGWRRWGACATSARSTSPTVGRRARWAATAPTAWPCLGPRRRRPGPRGAARRLPGPVLLVDDVVSSRWSLTVAGRALRQAGAPAVLPLVLAVDG